MVLRNDLVFVLVVEHEILHVIQQPLRWKEPADHPLQARTLLLDGLPINLLFLVVGAKPVEEVLPFRRDAANLGLNGVRENAKCIRQEELRDPVCSSSDYRQTQS